MMIDFNVHLGVINMEITKKVLKNKESLVYCMLKQNYSN